MDAEIPARCRPDAGPRSYDNGPVKSQFRGVSFDPVLLSSSPSTVLGVVTDGLDVALVTLSFQAADPERLAAILARYVVLTRGAPGCRNVDLCASVTRSDRLLVIEKWASRDAQRAHFDSDVMVEMARACEGVLVEPPEIDLWDGVSAHDLS
jgi:quinol monooxygenase YgiN